MLTNKRNTDTESIPFFSEQSELPHPLHDPEHDTKITPSGVARTHTNLIL